jgi:hypothetical protein
MCDFELSSVGALLLLRFVRSLGEVRVGCVCVKKENTQIFQNHNMCIVTTIKEGGNKVL